MNTIIILEPCSCEEPPMSNLTLQDAYENGRTITENDDKNAVRINKGTNTNTELLGVYNGGISVFSVDDNKTNCPTLETTNIRSQSGGTPINLEEDLDGVGYGISCDNLNTNNLNAESGGLISLNNDITSGATINCDTINPLTYQNLPVDSLQDAYEKYNIINETNTQGKFLLQQGSNTSGDVFEVQDDGGATLMQVSKSQTTLNNTLSLNGDAGTSGNVLVSGGSGIAPTWDYPKITKVDRKGDSSFNWNNPGNNDYTNESAKIVLNSSGTGNVPGNGTVTNKKYRFKFA